MKSKILCKKTENWNIKESEIWKYLSNLQQSPVNIHRIIDDAAQNQTFEWNKIIEKVFHIDGTFSVHQGAAVSQCSSQF